MHGTLNDGSSNPVPVAGCDGSSSSVSGRADCGPAICGAAEGVVQTLAMYTPTAVCLKNKSEGTGSAYWC